jgi:serine phosphatase RsbU (regulator of sigma subunit)
MNNKILESVLRFTGDAPQRDDLTLVTVKRL